MIIRQLNNSNLDEYTALFTRALVEHPTYFSSSPGDITGTITLESDSPQSFTLGAFDEHNTLLGIIGFYRMKQAKLAHKGFIYRMYVCSEAAGQGVGRELLQETLRRARELPDLDKIFLVVMSENSRAKQLYASEGFVAYGIEKRATKIDGVYYDEEPMVLVLSEK
jgi:RimJ/RimL family protein N-acetyltransferase